MVATRILDVRMSPVFGLWMRRGTFTLESGGDYAEVEVAVMVGIEILSQAHSGWNYKVTSCPASVVFKRASPGYLREGRGEGVLNSSRSFLPSCP
jgi:hypothetical protein